MTDETNYPPKPDTWHGAINERDHWIDVARIHEEDAKYYRNILDKLVSTVNTIADDLLPEDKETYAELPERIGHRMAEVKEYKDIMFAVSSLLGDVVSTGRITYADIPKEISSLFRMYELRAESAMAVFQKMYELLGVHPVSGNNLHELLTAITTRYTLPSQPTQTLYYAVNVLKEIEKYLSVILAGAKPDVTNIDTAEEGKIRLRITARNVNGQIQLAYMRDKEGAEHNFNENGGTPVFHICVDVDAYLLQPPEIPEVIGKFERRP